MAAPIPPMLKYSVVLNFLNSPPILIKFVSKFMVCNVFHFEAQCAFRLRSPLNYCIISNSTVCSACIKIYALPCFDRSIDKYSQHNYFIRTLASSWNKYGVECSSFAAIGLSLRLRSIKRCHARRRTLDTRPTSY